MERVELWKESLRMICARPWLGSGVNTYARVEPLYKNKSSHTDFQYAHNGYLQIAAETGLAGLASFLAAVTYFLWVSLRAFLDCKLPFLRISGLALVFGVFSFLIHSATDTNLHSTPLVNTLWVVMGLTWSAAEIARGRRGAAT